MIHLTDNAINAVRTAISGHEGDAVQGLRIMVQTGGCAGYKYSMGLVRDPAPTDFIVENGDVRVYVDADSEPHIKGTTVDFVVGLENSGFTFTNPNAVSKCSCGKSFG
jgi:iron-sulfur cluster assembly accessory protein